MPLYNPAAAVTPDSDATVTFTDIATNNSSTSKHGFLKKLDNSGAHFMDGTGAWSTPAGSSAGGILAVKAYAPATTVYSTTSATMADVDATNMAVTFTAPASGNVIVTLSAWQDAQVGPNVIWDLRESTTDLNVGGIILRNAASEAYTTLTCYLTGISAGSHTYKWSFGLVTAGGGATGRIVIGPGATGTGHFGPGIMVVHGAA